MKFNKEFMCSCEERVLLVYYWASFYLDRQGMLHDFEYGVDHIEDPADTAYEPNIADKETVQIRLDRIIYDEDWVDTYLTYEGDELCDSRAGA